MAETVDEFVDRGLCILGETGSEEDDRLNRENLTALYLVRDKLAPFVGAGLCYDYGIPGWGDLLIEAAQKIKEDTKIDLVSQIEALLKPETSGPRSDKSTESKRQQPSYGGPKYEEAAQLLANLPGRPFNAFLRSRLRHRKSPRHGAMRYVPAIARDIILTTNMDRVLESVFDTPPRIYCGTKISRRQSGLKEPKTGPEELNRENEQRKKSETGEDTEPLVAAVQRGAFDVLLKLHGDCERPGTRILTTQEYDHEYGRKKIDLKRPVPEALGLVFRSRTLLFLGCSLEDDRTVQVISQIAGGTRHYALLSSLQDKTRKKRLKQLENWEINPLFFRHREFDRVEEFCRFLAGAPTHPPDNKYYFLLSTALPRDREAVPGPSYNDMLEEELCQFPDFRRGVKLTLLSDNHTASFHRAVEDFLTQSRPGSWLFAIQPEEEGWPYSRTETTNVLRDLAATGRHLVFFDSGKSVWDLAESLRLRGPDGSRALNPVTVIRADARLALEGLLNEMKKNVFHLTRQGQSVIVISIPGPYSSAGIERRNLFNEFLSDVHAVHNLPGDLCDRTNLKKRSRTLSLNGPEWWGMCEALQETRLTTVTSAWLPNWGLKHAHKEALRLLRLLPSKASDSASSPMEIEGCLVLVLCGNDEIALGVWKAFDELKDGLATRMDLKTFSIDGLAQMETLAEAGPRTTPQTPAAKAYTMVVDFKEMCRTAINAVNDPLRCSGRVFGVPVRQWHEWHKARTKSVEWESSH